MWCDLDMGASARERRTRRSGSIIVEEIRDCSRSTKEGGETSENRMAAFGVGYVLFAVYHHLPRRGVKLHFLEFQDALFVLSAVGRDGLQYFPFPLLIGRLQCGSGQEKPLQGIRMAFNVISPGDEAPQVNILNSILHWLRWADGWRYRA